MNSSPTLFSAHPHDEIAPAQRPDTAMPLAEHGRLHLDLWIARHPALSVTAALVLGAVIGWFVKRR